MIAHPVCMFWSKDDINSFIPTVVILAILNSRVITLAWLCHPIVLVYMADKVFDYF
jgi:hypothetical protein